MATVCKRSRPAPHRPQRRRPRIRSMHALDRTAGPNDHEQPSASAPDLPLIARDGRDDHERPHGPSHDPDRAAPLGGRRDERPSSRRRAPSHSDAAAALLVTNRHKHGRGRILARISSARRRHEQCQLVTNRHKHGRGGILALVSPARPPRAQPQLVTNRHDPSAGAREVGAPPSPKPPSRASTRPGRQPLRACPPFTSPERRPPQPPSPASASPGAPPSPTPSPPPPTPSASSPRVSALLSPAPSPALGRGSPPCSRRFPLLAGVVVARPPSEAGTRDGSSPA